MHPLHDILRWFPAMDFAVLAHGFAPHGRDYFVHVQDCLGRDPGEHRFEFTHIVHLNYETRVLDAVWPSSWEDVFLDYEEWQRSGEPGGYVWGTNWSNAYSGIEVVEPSELADSWARRLGKTFYEVTLETDRFHIRMIFHSIRHKKISGDTKVIASVIVPMPKEAGPDRDDG